MSSLILAIFLLLPGADRPNVLWLTCEDMGPHLGFCGDRFARTPHLDALAKESVHFTRVWSHAPVCAPARTGLILGRYATSVGAEPMRSMVPLPAGTPSLPCALSYPAFQDAAFQHRVSPGTIVYSDYTSLAQLPREYGLRPAALVLSTIVSHPQDRIFTCDAGHKAVSADAGVPTGAVVGHTDWKPGKPSEEHLPIEIPEGVSLPAVGDLIYILPRHVCPTVNNFNDAVLVRN
ncbi:MAG: sulfatase-like hydrolase/transferase, partial [Gemmataceae bacterium]